MTEKSKATKEFLLENVLNVVIQYAAEGGKKYVAGQLLPNAVEKGVGFLLDYGATSIPTIGSAVSTYRTNKKIENLNTMLNLLNDRVDEINNLFEKQSIENKRVLDDVFNMVIEKISDTYQDEKIQYMISGYVELLAVENPSFDTAYLYFDTLDRLTILDLAVLKLSYGKENQTYMDILEKFDIDISQYRAIRENLYRMGLLESISDNTVESDLKQLSEAIDELKTVFADAISKLSSGKVKSIKKFTSKSNVKIKSKNRLKISKFGRDFVKFFLKESFYEN
jgi:hypothetical protein|nr:MAG TPA_asm: protein of unknown function (DUF4393) [Caudoviricetes sp.]